MDKTIKNIYIDVKSRMNESTYDLWIKRVSSVSKRLKKLRSDANNSLYNHFYKMSGIEDNAWMNILSDVEWLKDNVVVKCEGGEVYVKSVRSVVPKIWILFRIHHF